MIKALSRILKQDRERMNIPRSVQQVIPVKRIWLDGIWLVGNKYSKCWRFTDINYAIASKDDKTSMFLDYSELLNALDSNATTKITVCNKRMNLFCQSLQKLVAQHNALITSKISIKLLKLLTTPKKYGTVAAASLPRRKISLSVLPRYNKNVKHIVRAKFLEVKARQNSTF